MLEFSFLFCFAIVSPWRQINLFLNHPASLIIDGSEAAKTFRCVVCLCDPVDPQLCPKCAALFCQECLSTAYKVNNRRTCPHCRARVALGSFVRIPFIADYMSTLRKAQSAETPKPVADKCALHPAKLLSFYCRDCSKCTCKACWT